MILTPEHIKPFVDEEGVYDCNLILHQFAFKLLGPEVSPLGNIFYFKTPLRLGPLNIEEGIVLAGELPNVNMFGAVCFQRLYATQLGSLLSVLTGKDFYVEDSCLFSDDMQYSISILNRVKDSVVFHMIFPYVMFDTLKRFGTLGMVDSNLISEFVHNAIESFKYLTQSIFVETRRDDF